MVWDVGVRQDAVPLLPLNNNMEGTMPIIMIMEGTPPLRGVPYPTF